MRSLWNHLGDPSLHLLAIALIVLYLAFGRGPWFEDRRAEAPLPVCKVCRVHYLPGIPCACRRAGGIARAAH